MVPIWRPARRGCNLLETELFQTDGMRDGLQRASRLAPFRPPRPGCAVRAFAAGILPANLTGGTTAMLTPLVTRALSQLVGAPLTLDRIKGRFRYARSEEPTAE